MFANKMLPVKVISNIFMEYLKQYKVDANEKCCFYS